MTDTKSIREQTIRDTKTNLILDAARKVFAEMGFFETRLEDIAAAAGFSKASLYSYYSDKEDIFMSLAIRELDTLYQRLENASGKQGSFLKNLEEMLVTMFDFFGEHMALLLAVSNFQTMCGYHKEKLSEKHKELFIELPRRFEKIIAMQVALIKTAQENRKVRSDIDARKIADYLGALVRGIIFHWKVTGRIGGVREEIHQLIRFMAHGLKCTETIGI